MKIVLSTPARSVRRTGNRCTARQWADMLTELGHEVAIREIETEPEDDTSNFLIALHGGRSHGIIARFRSQHPAGKLVVAMTGTDIYPEPGAKVLESIAMADRIVVLQRKAANQIPIADREKVRVIFQSATPFSGAVERSVDTFDICVVGHLRDVKDPLRAAFSSRLLPDSSRIRVLHAGGILDEKYRELVDREQLENPRYRWLGELDEEAVGRLIASSQVMVLSSFAEGGARVVGEAIVNGTPVLSSRIDGVRGLLSDDYPGYFPPGDTAELCRLMNRIEQDADFRNQLHSEIEKAAPRFHPAREKEGWKSLVDELID